MKKPIITALCTLSFVLGAFAQNFPPNGEISEEIAIGGPSKDYLTLAFPRPDITQCAPFTGETRTVGGDIQKYGKALLVVIFPKDCPYCIKAADEAGAVINKYRDKLTVWYANQRLNGDGSCADIEEMKNKYPFVKGANFCFIDVYMWNNDWGTPWHYGSQDSYWTRKESPSVYRIFSPKTKKVTGIAYYVSGIESQIIAAVNENFTPGGTGTVALKAANNFQKLSIDQASGFLNLDVTFKNSGRAVVSIVNTAGQQILKQDIGTRSSFTTHLGIQKLEKGTYVVAVALDGKTVATQKFVRF